LQIAGFAVYVHENRDQVKPAIYGLFNYGQANYGSTGVLPTYSICANHVIESRDADFDTGEPDNENFLFFVGGSTLGTRADVPENRKNEFRELLLKLKPGNMAALLLIDYI